MIVRPWKIGDTEKIMLQPAQQYTGSITDLSVDLTPLSDQGLAWTVEHDDVVIGIGGLSPQWENRAIVWALLAGDIGHHFPAIHRSVRRFLIMSPFRRIEAHVDVGFKEGIRWMKMLGFECEAYMKAFRPDGADMLLFARVRSWRS